jgi:hypothetical protein
MMCLFNVISTKYLRDCDFASIVANCDPANAVLYVNNYAAHEFFLFVCGEQRIPPSLKW